MSEILSSVWLRGGTKETLQLLSPSLLSPIRYIAVVFLLPRCWICFEWTIVIRMSGNCWEWHPFKKHNSYLDINWDPYTLMHFFHTLLIFGGEEIIHQPSAHSILMPPTFHIAHLKGYTPNLPPVWPTALLKVRKPRFLVTYTGHFGGVFFLENYCRFLPIACHTSILKPMHLRVSLRYLRTLLVHPRVA